MRRLGVDLDGCVYDWDLGMRHACRARGVDVPLGPPASYDELKEAVPGDVWHWAWNGGCREIFASLPAFAGALDALRSAQRRVELHVITHRPTRVADITLLALAHAGLRPASVQHVHGRPKSDVWPSCHAYVEDRPEIALELANRTAAELVLVPRHSYSETRETRMHPRIRLFDDWGEVVKWASA